MSDERWPFTNYGIARWRFHWIIGRVHRCSITGHETVEPEFETGAKVNAKWLAHLLNNATKEQLDAAHKAALTENEDDRPADDCRDDVDAPTRDAAE